MVKPRRGKLVRIAPSPGHSIRRFVDAVVTDVAREWVLADVVAESWRFRVGTGLLLRRSALLERDGQLIAPSDAVQGVYPPETRTVAHATEAMNRLLGPSPGDDDRSRD